MIYTRGDFTAVPLVKALNGGFLGLVDCNKQQKILKIKQSLSIWLLKPGI